MTGLVQLQGRSSYAGTQISIGSQTLSTQADGTFSLMLEPGLYPITASHSLYLNSETTIAVDGSPSTTIPSVTLLAGDVTGDGIIDLTDLVIVATGYGQSVPPGDVRADINGDETTDLLDLVLLGLNYGKTGAQPWDTPGADLSAAKTDSTAAVEVERADSNRKRPPALEPQEALAFRLPAQVKAGQVFDAPVVFSGGETVLGADVTVRFDAAQLELVDAQEPADNALLNPAQRFTAVKTLDPAGSMRYAAALLGRPTSKPGDLLLTLRFRARQDGVPRITLDHTTLVGPQGRF